MSENTDYFAKAITAVTATQHDMKGVIGTLSETVSSMSAEIKALKITASECDQFRTENKELNEEVERLKEQRKAIDTVCTQNITSGLNGLFRDQPNPLGSDGQPYEHPVDAKGRKKQFAGDNFLELMQDVLKRDVRKKEFGSALDRITQIIIPAIACGVKEKYNIDDATSFSKSDPRARLLAIDELEEKAYPYMPLRACSASWGASMLLGKFWTKRESKQASGEKGTCSQSLIFLTSSLL